MNLVIDALEYQLARVELEDGRLIDLPTSWLPSLARAGDHLTAQSDGDGVVRFTVDPIRTRAALKRNQEALETLNQTDTGGDLHL